MFVSFDFLGFMFWFIISTLLPGSIMSFSILRKDERFVFLEKLIIGLALGVFVLPLLPFLLYLVLGINFSYPVAIASVVFAYVVSLVLFFRYGGMEVIQDISQITKPINDFFSSLKDLLNSQKHLYSVVLFLLLLATYLVRIGSYSPIFQELDPYFYTYTASQILSIGHNPLNDQTAWFPEVTVNHRIIPGLSYLESVWYSLYTHGGSYDHMTLALVASMYPPIAAVLAVFFVYLVVSSFGKKEWALVAASILAFAPIFVYKLAAGEHEVQPYTFFALAFFFSMFAFLIKTRELKFASLASLGFFAIALTTNSYLLAIVGVILYVLVYSTILFLRDKDENELKFILTWSSIIFVGLFFGSLLKFLFAGEGISYSSLAQAMTPIAYCALLYFAKKYFAKDQATQFNRSAMLLVAIAIVCLLAAGFTPIGSYIINLGKAGFDVAGYSSPLTRTIAEQGLAPSDFSDQMGFVAETPDDIAGMIVNPLKWLLGDTSPVVAGIANIFSLILTIIFVPFSLLVNLVFQISVSLINSFLSTKVEFGVKSNSFFLFWIFAFFSAVLYSAYKFFRKEETNSTFMLLFFAFILPLIVGVIKAKYEIYALFLMSIMIGFSLSTFDLERFSKYRKYLVGFAVAVGLLQFFYGGIAPSLLYSSTVTLYQNNPMALSAKFQNFCTLTNDSEVCAAAADPMGYASMGTNYQYNSKLCTLSVISDPTKPAPAWEAFAASFRCQRISSYWTDSMEWIGKNTPNGSRITSWWDYGHWINYFGERNTVLRNEHASHTMIGAVAQGYLSATPEELRQYMISHDSDYALFDAELILGQNDLGAKYGALNYLSCAYENKTDVSTPPGGSVCEANQLWERIYVTTTPCTISNLTRKIGVTGYVMNFGSFYSPIYPSECRKDVVASNQNAANYCSLISPQARYCIGNVTLANGQTTYGTYYLNETYPNGDLKLNKASLQMAYTIPNTVALGDVYSFLLLYTKDQAWVENGQVVNGYSDRKGDFYDSALYQALFLGELPGFRLVYSSPNGGAVKIYQVIK